jgi:hypothetical protein
MGCAGAMSEARWVENLATKENCQSSVVYSGSENARDIRARVQQVASLQGFNWELHFCSTARTPDSEASQ